jgi:hypothetical protein
VVDSIRPSAVEFAAQMLKAPVLFIEAVVAAVIATEAPSAVPFT